MTKKRSKKEKEVDIGVYESSSTIDTPPPAFSEGEEAQPEQQQLLDTTDEADTIKDLNGDSIERLLDVDLTLRIKRGKTYTIPLLIGKYNSTRILDLLRLALTGRRNVQVIEAILDNPQVPALASAKVTETGIEGIHVIEPLNTKAVKEVESPSKPVKKKSNLKKITNGIDKKMKELETESEDSGAAEGSPVVLSEF